MSTATGKIISITSAFMCFLHYLGFYSNGYSHGALQEQIMEVTKEIEQDSTDALLYLKRGELYRYHRDWDLALSDFDLASRLDANLDIVVLGRGKTLFEAGWYERAKPVLDHFLLKSPNHIEGLLTRARVLRHLGQNLAAAVDYTQALAGSHEPRPEHYIERAQAIITEGREYWPAAISGLDEGLEKLGQIVTLQLLAIDLEVKLKQYDGAIARIAQVESQSPRKEKWLLRRGQILTAAGRLGKAQACYGEALSRIETLTSRKRNLQSTLRLEGEIRAALAEVVRRRSMETKNG